MREQKPFNLLLKEARLNANLSIREICRRLDYDASNWSKIERGLIPPPPGNTIIRKWAKALGLESESDEYEAFVDAASASRFEIPEDLQNERIMSVLPAFFRANRNEKLTREDYERLVKLLKKS